MTTVTLTREDLKTGVPAVLIAWDNLGGSDVGSPLTIVDYPDQTVVIDGTFDGGTCTLQGSMDGTNWYSLTDPQGNAIAKNAAAMEFVTEAPMYVRPSVSGGGAGSAIDVRILARRVTR